MSADFLFGDVIDLPKRGIFATTCAKFGYRRAFDKNGKPVQVADYRDQDGNLVMQKVRTPGKEFWTIGSSSKVPFFGQHLWKGGKRLVVTEGEIDCLTVAQAFNNSWPVVSLPLGAGNAERAFRDNIAFLEGFETVVIMFDMDEPGRTAATSCAKLLKPGRAHIAEMSEKDANELLTKGKGGEIAKAVYEARAWRPDGIVSLKEIRSAVLTKLEVGRAWPWEALTKVTYGRRIGDVIGFGAGTGVGKTDVFTQCIAFDVSQGIRCGVLYLEQGVAETGRRVAGKQAGKRFHVPDGSWTQGELEHAWDALEATDLIHLYDNFGAMDWATVRAQIMYMIEGLACEHIYLDHLTALAAGEEDENAALKVIMADLASIAKGKAIIHYISHLATPEGKPHEEGGRVMIRHFRGSRAIGFWSHLMFGIERDTQADDPRKRQTTIVRCLKDRAAGTGTGQTVELRYDRQTGVLHQEDEAMAESEMAPEF